MVNRISNLIKEMNQKELITASGEQGKIKRLIRLEEASDKLLRASAVTETLPERKPAIILPANKIRLQKIQA